MNSLRPTPDEARALAAALIERADACDRPGEHVVIWANGYSGVRVARSDGILRDEAVVPMRVTT